MVLPLEPLDRHLIGGLIGDVFSGKDLPKISRTDRLRLGELVFDKLCGGVFSEASQHPSNLFRSSIMLRYGRSYGVTALLQVLRYPCEYVERIGSDFLRYLIAPVGEPHYALAPFFSRMSVSP